MTVCTFFKTKTTTKTATFIDNKLHNYGINLRIIEEFNKKY